MRRFTSALALTVAVATLAACSDDNSSSDSVAASTTVAAPAPSDAVDETVADTVSVDDTLTGETVVDGGDAPGAGSEFCTINQTLDDAASAAIDEDGTPATLQQFFEVEFPARFAEMTAAAPADLVDDMAVLGDGFTTLGELFAANEWDLEAAFADPSLTDVLDNQAYVDAGTAVDAYCGA